MRSRAVVYKERRKAGNLVFGAGAVGLMSRDCGKERV